MNNKLTKINNNMKKKIYIYNNYTLNKMTITKS